MNTIDLDLVANRGAVRNLAGKPRGEDARRQFKLDELDVLPGEVRVSVPDYVYAISSSFFLGLFSQSVVRLGSAEAFLNHYRFSADESVMQQIRHGLDRCLIGRLSATEAS